MGKIGLHDLHPHHPALFTFNESRHLCSAYTTLAC